MLGQEQDIIHTRFFGSLCPLIGIAGGCTEERDIMWFTGPLLTGERTVRPADKHAETKIGYFLCPDRIRDNLFLITTGKYTEYYRVPNTQTSYYCFHDIAFRIKYRQK